MMKYFFLSGLYVLGIVKMGYSQVQPTNTDPAKSYVNVNTPKTPESAGFDKYGYAQVNEFTGTPNISVPVYILKSRFLEAPITLSYQTTGIRVNQEASWAGLGFDLIAGGRITVETRGSVDFSSSTNGLTSPALQIGMQQIFRRLGYSRDNAVFTPATFWDPPTPCSTCPVDTNMYNGNAISEMTQFGTGEPDIFRANFMGHSVTFYVDKISNTIKFIGEKSTFKINYTTDSYKNITGWTLIDNDGVTYYFNQTEKTTNTYTGSPIVPSVTTSAWLLTKAVHPSGDDIQFSYTNYGYSVPAFSMNGSVDVASPGGTTISSDQHQNISMQSPYYLTRMETSDVVVDFILETRTDLYGPGSRKIPQIKVRDKISNIDKQTMTLYTSYFQGTINTGVHNYLKSLSYYFPPSLSKDDYLACSNKRLRLDSVRVNDNYQPAYRFYYNSFNIVPDKYSYGQDHWGYYNGVNNETNGYSFSHLVPYGGTRGVQNSLPPSGLGFNTSSIGINRDCDSTKMLAMTMDSIVYPTGGSTRFYFEPHKSTMFPTVPVTGGGLRIKQMRNYASGSLTGIKEYTYTSGKYMGTINYFTNSMVMNACYNPTTQASIAHFKYSSNGAVNANEILIGYEKITIAEKNISMQKNGYLVKTFNIHTPSSYYSNGIGFDQDPPYFVPGDPGSNVQGYGFTVWLQAAYKNLPPTPSANLEGKLLQEQYFDNSGNLLKSVKYYYRLADYSNDFYDIKAFQNRANGFEPCGGNGNQYGFSGFGSGGWRAVNLFVSPAKSFRTLTDSITEVTYQGAKSIVQKKSFTYDERYQLRSETEYNSDNTTKVISYTHPYDYFSIGINGNTSMVYQMLGRNIITPVFSTKVMQNGVLIDSVFNLYHNPSSGIFVPQHTQVQIRNNPMEIRQVYNAYDNYGHLLERQKPGGIKESYLWGYNKKFPVAQVLNSDFSTISSIVNNSVLDNPASDDALRTELNKLRTQIPGAMVTTYTYDRVFGITSVSDPNGRTNYYEYDGMGRLALIRDQDNKIVKKICYNYAGQPGNCPSPCTNFAADWQNTETPLRCQQGICGNTGFQEQEQKDLNPCSATYNQVRWVLSGNNATACPASTNIIITYNNALNVAGFTAVYSNTATGQVYSFAVPASGSGQLGCVPAGAYTLTVSKPGNTLLVLFGCGCKSVSSTSASFYKVNVSASACNTITLNNDY